MFIHAKKLAFSFAFSMAILMIISCALVTLPINPTPSVVLTQSASLVGIGNTQVSPKDHAVMIYVPAGQFPMGSEFGLVDEQPVHRVQLDAYWLDRTEVTNEMYQKCVEAARCKEPGKTIYYNDRDYSNHPVVFVSWTDAVAYCSYAGRRLPTEAEWEKAAAWDPKKNEKRVYPWGSEYDCSKGNFDDETQLDASLMQPGSVSCDGYIRTAPVGSYPQGASPYGALDMGGNVWEWVHDAFLGVDPFSAGSQNYYAVSRFENPRGVDPSITDYRSLRGGSWGWIYGYARSSYRLGFGKNSTFEGIGFRCAESSVLGVSSGGRKGR